MRSSSCKWNLLFPTFIALTLTAPVATAQPAQPAQPAPPGPPAPPAPPAPTVKQLPRNLSKFSPSLVKKYMALVRKGAAVYGPGKRSLPRFKKDTSRRQRDEALQELSRVMKQMKADRRVSADLRDAVRVWERMTAAQKNEVLSESDAVMGMWPVAVTATAAAVTAAVAVADFAYKVYVDQRDNTGGDKVGGDSAGDARDVGGDDGTYCEDPDQEECLPDEGLHIGAIKGALGY